MVSVPLLTFATLTSKFMRLARQGEAERAARDAAIAPDAAQEPGAPGSDPSNPV